MASPHLIRKLIVAARTARIRVRKGRVIRATVNGRTIKAYAICVTSGDGNWIEVALRAHTTPGELVHSLIHELCHFIGYSEEAVAGGLDDAAFKSRALREAVAIRLLGLIVFPPKVEKDDGQCPSEETAR